MLLLSTNEINNNETFSQVDLNDYQLDKYVEKRGYIYVVKDAMYPNLFKVGRTFNIVSRLSDYNADRPISTVYLYGLSKPFKDVHEVENKLLEQLYKICLPLGLRREWFDIELLDSCVELIGKAEEQFTTL